MTADQELSNEAKNPSDERAESPRPAPLGVSACRQYAAGIETQNDLSGAVENWADFHKGERYAALQLATLLSRADTDAETRRIEARDEVVRALENLQKEGLYE